MTEELRAGDRVLYPGRYGHGLGTVIRAGNQDQQYAATAPIVVQFDSGKRYVVLGKRLRRVEE